jgi:uncharacterized repeat protein (TIGR01451 family)
MKKTIFIISFIALLAPLTAFAKPQISVSITAEKEQTVTENGSKVTKKVPATSIDAGDVIFYTINYVNSGNEAATNAVLDDPIPQGTSYIPASAYGDGSDVSFSINHGKGFKKPSLLTYEVKKSDGSVEKRATSSEEYTNIRWTIARIPAGARGKVGFQVKVKR